MYILITMDNTLTVAEAAKALNVATRTIRRHIKSGDLKTELVAGKYGMEYRILALPKKLNAHDIPQDIPHDSGLSSALDMATELQKENKYLALSLENTREKVSQLEKLLLTLHTNWSPLWSTSNKASLFFNSTVIICIVYILVVAAILAIVAS